MTRDRLLFYCQHSLDLGHLARSLRLAEGLSERFDVRLLDGGRLPAGWPRRSAPAVRSASCCTTRSPTTAGSPRWAPCSRC